MFDSNALTRVHSAILATIIVVAAVGGTIAYIWLDTQSESAESIKIGVLADLDNWRGERIWQGALLAAEHINAEGGILGREVELIGEDDDSETKPFDLIKVQTALTKLLSVHKVDFVIGGTSNADGVRMSQDILFDHKRILLAVFTGDEFLTQRVVDDYEKYKYYFRIFPSNTSSISDGLIDTILRLRELTDFNKIAYLGADTISYRQIMEDFDYYLPEVYGFNIVHKNKFPSGTVDFSSYFAAMEASGAEIVIPLINGEEGIPFVKEWHDRQSPMVMWGINSFAKETEFWNWTDGKCEHIVFNTVPATAGYPLTSKVLPMREAYVERWGEVPISAAIAAYDAIRTILPDAVERAGTIETEAVVKALEKTKIETCMARNFVFTSSHDVMTGENPNNPDEDYLVVLMFQWQADKTWVPVYPKDIMEEAGATYIYPPWSGPWDEE